jgi:hypothetical protein
MFQNVSKCFKTFQNVSKCFIMSISLRDVHFGYTADWRTGAGGCNQPNSI